VNDHTEPLVITSKGFVPLAKFCQTRFLNSVALSEMFVFVLHVQDNPQDSDGCIILIKLLVDVDQTLETGRWTTLKLQLAVVQGFSVSV